MKTTNCLRLVTLVTAALSLNITTLVGQPIDSVESLKNRAVAASPRAKEVFPWLTRAPLPRTEPCCVEASPKNELAEAKKNRGIAASPRALEQFSELARPAAPRHEFMIAPLVEKNSAILSNPRAREEFPALSRGSPPPGTAKGGASKLMKLGK